MMLIFLQEFKTTLHYGKDPFLGSLDSSNTTAMFVLDYEELMQNSTLENLLPTTGFAVSLTRFPYPFFFNTYLPTELLTLISFIGFLIPVDVVPGRTALLVTIFLMLVNISNMVQSRGPVVRTVNLFSHASSYLKYAIPSQTSDLTMLDIWLLLCVIFVALALFEYAILLAIRFGKQNIKIHDNMTGNDELNAVAKCRKIDRHALRVFLALHAVTVCTYFSIIYAYRN